MGKYTSSGIGKGTSFSNQITVENYETNNKLLAAVNELNKLHSKIKLPTNESQLKHIFRKAEGHYLYSKKNIQKLLDLSNDKSKYVGTDKYGVKWNISTFKNGRQVWVRYKDNKIINGGYNLKPKIWNNETGLSKNPNGGN